MDKYISRVGIFLMLCIIGVYFNCLVAQAFNKNSYYRIIARHSGKCLDVWGGSTDNNVDIQQYECHNVDNQLFQLDEVLSNGRYRIIARHSGKCFTVENDSQENNARIIQYSCKSWMHWDNQVFWVNDIGSGYYTIKALHSGKCLDVPGSSKEDEVVIQQYDCHGGSNQEWRIR